jgi:hypothetical protein
MTMNSQPFRSLLGAAMALSLSLCALAQTTYCLSVHGGPATGVNTLGAPSQLAAAIGGAPNVGTGPTAGQTAAQASAAHEAAFIAAGYTTARTGPNQFCVTAGPGAAALAGGLAYGCDDTNLDIDTKVRRAPVAPGAPPAAGGKDSGVPVPVPPDQQPPMPMPGLIQILIYIDDHGTLVIIQVVIQLPPGLNGQQLRLLIEQALRAAGLLPNRVRYPSVLQSQGLVDGLYLDRTMTGAKVYGIEYQYDAMSRRIVHQNGGAGFLPDFGASEYGVATRGAAPIEPWAHVQGFPQIGSFFDVTFEFGMPNTPGATVLSLGQGVAPIANGWLMVDLATAFFTFTMSDGLGNIQLQHTVPMVPALIGLPLHEQAGLLGPGGQLSLTNAVRSVID